MCHHTSLMTSRSPWLPICLSPQAELTSLLLMSCPYPHQRTRPFLSHSWCVLIVCLCVCVVNTECHYLAQDHLELAT
jgi:hypothetical protein